MNQNRIIVLALGILLTVLVVRGAVYTVDEREKAIVVQLGQVIRSNDTPGIHFKIPAIQEVHFFDGRILTLDADPQRYLTEEKKSLVVDSFVKWRITDPLKFYLAVSGDEAQARTLLQQRVNGGLRDEFGKRTLTASVSKDRRAIRKAVTESTNAAARDFGIEVIDVRLQRVELPQQVSSNVFERMEAERARIAKDYRARGAEEAEKIRAEAERKREVLLAEAYGKSEQIRGEGDGKAAAIYANAYNKHPDFYALYRSLTAYKQSFSSKSDVMIVDPSSEFFKYLKKSRGN